MIYELSPVRRGTWDDFQVRKIGLAVQRRMARDFNGDPDEIRSRSVYEVTKALNLSIVEWKAAELVALQELALPLALIPDLNNWSNGEKDQLTKVIRAKAGADESTYLRAMQNYPPLREEFIKLGSGV